ncbi:hypothetical protein RDV89_02475 [Nocardioides zeae]|uniref:Uncharacterized protein n=1 Tax=Nocardioides imazamoxiresistens TaxID=3231893 RepID=A0ABU3PRR4_9ACTN|nr:hypothetical protein [Nocardioides zeae]MDT9591916.1 hypothetical protein [Nocardioides zeae]
MTILHWRPDLLAHAADLLALQRRALAGLDADLDAARPPWDWRSVAAEAARAQYGALDRDYLEHLAELTCVVSALDDAAAVIARAQQEVESALAAIRAHGWSVTLVGDTAIATPPPACDATGSGDALTGALVVEPLVAAVTASVRTARAADEALAAALRSVAHEQVTTTAVTADQAVLPPGLRGLRTAQLVELALADPEAVVPYLLHLEEHQRRAVGTEIADEIERLGAFGVVDTGGKGPEQVEVVPTDELEDHALALAGLAAAAERLGTDPVVASAVLHALGPEGFVAEQVVARPWATALSGVAGGAAALAGHQRAMRVVLAHGTAGVDASAEGRHVPGRASVDREWVDDLVAALDQEIAVPGSAPVTGHQVVAPLLGPEVPQPSAYLLTSVADAVLDKEAALVLAGHERVWDPLALSRDLDLGGPGLGADPLLPVLRSIAEHPVAAQELVNATTTGLFLEDPAAGVSAEHRDVFGASVDRLDYLLRLRAVEPGTQAESLAALADVLTTAATPDRPFAEAAVPALVDGDTDHRAPFVQAADRALGAVSEWPGGGRRDLPFPVADAVADIMSLYVHDVSVAMSPVDGLDGQNRAPLGWYAPDWGRLTVEPGHVENLLVGLGEHVGPSDQVRTALLGHAETGILRELDRAAGDPVRWEAAVHDVPTVYGSSLHASLDALGQGELRGALLRGDELDALRTDQADGDLSAALRTPGRFAVEATFAASSASLTAANAPAGGAAAGTIMALGERAALHLFPDPYAFDSSDQVRHEHVTTLARSQVAAEAVVHNAVYQTVPLEHLAAAVLPEGVDPFVVDGARVPMEELTATQVAYWLQVSSGVAAGTGPEALAVAEQPLAGWATAASRIDAASQR